MKTSDIEVGKDYRVGAPGYSSRATVIAVKVKRRVLSRDAWGGAHYRDDGIRIKYAWRNDETTEVVAPVQVMAPWSDADDEKAALAKWRSEARHALADASPLRVGTFRVIKAIPKDDGTITVHLKHNLAGTALENFLVSNGIDLPKKPEIGG